jgi:hypothetical protein
MKIEYGEITVTKITRNVWTATCNTISPFKSEVNMSASTEENARKKMELFFNNEPYNHLK